MTLKRATIFILVVLLIGTLFYAAEFSRINNGLLEVKVLDIGQGDAIYIKSPSGKQILIDGGPNSSVVSELRKHMSWRDREIDIMVLSHPDSDHVSGLASVLEAYDIDYFVHPEIEADTKAYKRFVDQLYTESALIIGARAGRRIDLGDGLHLNIIYPFTGPAQRKVRKSNNESVVIALEYEKFKMLLTGDIESTVEKKLVTLASASLPTTVLKIAHHGSGSSSTDAFLNASRPLIAVISAGEGNRYNHPAQAVLERLEKNNIPYYRTDAHGTISITTDGEVMSIKQENNHEKRK